MLGFRLNHVSKRGHRSQYPNHNFVVFVYVSAKQDVDMYILLELLIKYPRGFGHIMYILIERLQEK